MGAPLFRRGGGREGDPDDDGDDGQGLEYPRAGLTLILIMACRSWQRAEAPRTC